MSRWQDKLVRKLVPSVPLLSRTPLAPVLDVADRMIVKRRPEWSALPPASLRMRVGVGNSILRNHAYFIDSANELVDELSERGALTPDSRVVELGCGCGRNALALKRFLGPAGRYAGQDVDAEMIRWCVANLADDRFRFDHADLYSRVYNPRGKRGGPLALPADDRSASLVFAVSVFSHLLVPDAARYLGESARVLEPEGRLYITTFLMDHLGPWLGSRWSFEHRAGDCHVENLRYPEAAVAYDLELLERLLDEHGFALHEVYHRDRPQQTVVARRQA